MYFTDNVSEVIFIDCDSTHETSSVGAVVVDQLDMTSRPDEILAGSGVPILKKSRACIAGCNIDGQSLFSLPCIKVDGVFDNDKVQRYVVSSFMFWCVLNTCFIILSYCLALQMFQVGSKYWIFGSP